MTLRTSWLAAVVSCALAGYASEWDRQVAAVRDDDSRRVKLVAERVDDQRLEDLLELPELRELILDETTVTDAGLTSIAELPSLKYLHLIDVPITHQGLEHPHGASRRQSFYIDGGQVTADGIAALGAEPVEQQVLVIAESADSLE